MKKSSPTPSNTSWESSKEMKMIWKESMKRMKRIATKTVIMITMKTLMKSQRNPRRTKNNTKNLLIPLEAKREIRAIREVPLKSQNANNNERRKKK